MYKPIFLLLLFPLLIACKQTEDTGMDVQASTTSLKGHWVSEDVFKNRVFTTLDISDSILIHNKRSIYGFDRQPLMIDGIIYLPLYEFYNTPLFDLRGDELTIIDTASSETLTYRRMNKDSLWKQEYFQRSFLDIDLLVFDGKEKLVDFTDAEELIADISVGRLKKGYLEEYSHIRKDSVLIQVNDVLIDYELIPDYLATCIQAFHDERRLVVRLHIDSHVPKSIEEKIYKLVHSAVGPRKLLVRTGFLTSKKTLAYKRIP